MPLQKLQLRPGVNREGTTLANEGGWFESDKVRFRSGYPEKIGGWAALSRNTFLGIARSLWNWVTLKGYNLMGVGTNLKFYVEWGGAYYDITPIRATTAAGDVTFSAVTVFPYSSTITVSDTAHGAQTGDFVTFSGAVGLGGNITAAVLNQQYQITFLTTGTYTVQARAVSTVEAPGAAVLSNASDVGNGGAAVVGTYQITTGSDIYTIGTGWGAGPWNGAPIGVSTDPWAHGWGTGYTSGIGIQLRLWSQTNFGENLLFSPRGGALYYWTPGTGATPSFAIPGTLVSGGDVPSVLNQVMVSDATRIVIAFGCNNYSETTQDPLLIRWSAQESYTNWTPAAANQAGSYRLSHGSTIVQALQTRQEILVWTDSAVYSMQYLGPPYVYGFTLLADNISIISPNAATTANGVTYWMGTDKFYMYSGRVETLPCSLRTYVFDDINKDQSAQFFAGTNEGFSEAWWFYCSANSNVVDRYVIFNYLDRVWYYGTMGRTAWLDTSLRAYPQAATYIPNIVEHEAIVDNGEIFGTVSAISAYVQSSDFDIGDGHNYGFVWRMIPDITFDGSTTATGNPQVTFTLRPRQNPGAPYGTTDIDTVTTPQSYATRNTYTVQEFTEIVYTRVRGRQMAFRVSSGGDTALGTQWQLGVPRIDVRPDGRR